MRARHIVFFAVFLTLLNQLAARNTQIIIPARSISLFEEALEHGSKELTGFVFGKILKQIVQDGSRVEDKEMVGEISEDFAKIKGHNKLFSIPEIRNFLKEIPDYIEKWKKDMYMSLIKIYNIDYDNDFLQEMLSDPEFYGLTYDSYKIMTFNVDALAGDDGGSSFGQKRDEL